MPSEVPTSSWPDIRKTTGPRSWEFLILDTDSNQVVYSESFALPLGASSAVTGFNRAAMSRLLYLVNTSFFDDYCQMELEGLTDSADYAALELLRLLGWEVSEGEKLRPFAPEFTMALSFPLRMLPKASSGLGIRRAGLRKLGP